MVCGGTQSIKYGLQALREARVGGANFGKQAIDKLMEGAREFGGREFAYHRGDEGRGDLRWELVNTAGMDRRQIVTEAGKGERVIAKSVDHVQRLPGLMAGNRTADMQSVEPRHTDENCGGSRRKRCGFGRASVHQAKGRSQGAEIGGGRECQVDLKRVGLKEDAVEPGAGTDVDVMQGVMMVIHAGGEVGDDRRHVISTGDAESEVDIGPLVLAARCGRTGNRRSGYARVGGSKGEKIGAEGVAVGVREHGVE